MVAQTALAILNLIMHVARIFMAYMSGKLKGGKKKKETILPVWKRTFDIKEIWQFI